MKVAEIKKFVRKYSRKEICNQMNDYSSNEKFCNDKKELDSLNIEIEVVDYDGEGYINFWNDENKIYYLRYNECSYIFDLKINVK